MRPAIISNPAKFILALVCLNVFGIFHTGADAENLTEKSSCFLEARSWIAELPPEKGELMRNHARESCALSLNWLKDYGKIKEDSTLERVCTNLVLIWTHKKCIYFRRYFSPDAYEPCELWARSQYKHCINQDVEWFEGSKKNGLLNQE